MGYFSNGTESQCFQAAYCERCVNYGPPDGPGCPIWGLHLDWNYEQCETESTDVIRAAVSYVKRRALSAFIPYDNGRTGDCKMFVKAEDGDGK